MDPRTPAAHLAEALIRAGEYPRSARKAAAAERKSLLPVVPAFTIALSREVGARGTAVASEVGRRLGWPVYDHELLQQIAKDMRVAVHLLERVDERPGSWLQECVEAFAALPSITEVGYFRRLLKMLLALGSQGECVIVGRGAAQLLPPETTLRVRLLASQEDRIAVVSRELGLTPHEAARYVESRDRERIRFLKDHFQKDPTDPQHYDLVLNSSRLSVVTCAELIIQALRSFQAQPPQKLPVPGP